MTATEFSELRQEKIKLRAEEDKSLLNPSKKTRFTQIKRVL